MIEPFKDEIHRLLKDDPKLDARADYPAFTVTHGIDDVLQEIHDVNAERWLADAAIR